MMATAKGLSIPEPEPTISRRPAEVKSICVASTRSTVSKWVSCAPSVQCQLVDVQLATGSRCSARAELVADRQVACGRAGAPRQSGVAREQPLQRRQGELATTCAFMLPVAGVTVPVA